MDQRQSDDARLDRALSGSMERERMNRGGWLPSNPDDDRHWLAEHGMMPGHRDERAVERFGHWLEEGLERRAQRFGRYIGLGPKGWTRSDERIREEVCERLTAHGEIDATDIEVQVSNGEVTLKGTVADRRMKRLAADEADRTLGVKDVDNRIKLQAPGA